MPTPGFELLDDCERVAGRAGEAIEPAPEPGPRRRRPDRRRACRRSRPAARRTPAGSSVTGPGGKGQGEGYREAAAALIVADGGVPGFECLQCVWKPDIDRPVRHRRLCADPGRSDERHRFSQAAVRGYGGERPGWVDM